MERLFWELSKVSSWKSPRLYRRLAAVKAGPLHWSEYSDQGELGYCHLTGVIRLRETSRKVKYTRLSDSSSNRNNNRLDGASWSCARERSRTLGSDTFKSCLGGWPVHRGELIISNERSNGRLTEDEFDGPNILSQATSNEGIDGFDFVCRREDFLELCAICKLDAYPGLKDL